MFDTVIEPTSSDPRPANQGILFSLRLFRTRIERGNIDRRRRRAGSRGLTLVEVMISTLFTSVLLIAALTGLSTATRTNQASADTAFAAQLGEELASEILSHPFKDPDGGSWIGTESSENDSDRTSFDDVDDFDDWDSSPPLNRDGSARAGATGWRRQVDVSHVLRSSPNSNSLLETGLKRISITVTSPTGRSFQWRLLKSHAGLNETKSAFDETFVQAVELQIESRQGRARRQSRTATVNHAQTN